MDCASHEVLVELAFALANEERIEGEALRVLRHADTCGECKRILSESSRILSVTRRLFAGEPATRTSASCIDDNRLSEYADGAVSREQRDEIEVHLATCRPCLLQLLDLYDCLEAGHVAPTPLQYVVELAQRGLRMLAHPAEGYEDCSPAAVTVLAGDADQRIHRWTQEIDGAVVEISVEHLGADHVSVRIQPKQMRPAPEDTRLTVYANAEIVQSEMLPDSGYFTLRDLPAGDYTIELEMPGSPRTPVRLNFTPPR